MKRTLRIIVRLPWLIFAGFVLCSIFFIGIKLLEYNYPIEPIGQLVFTQSYADKQLANMTLKQKVSSLFVLHLPGTDTNTLKSFLDEYQPSGLIFMGDNIPETTDQLVSITSELQTNSSLPYLFAVDEEGGIVKRLPGDNYLSAYNLKNLPASSTKDAFIGRTNLLNSVGLNLNFGIVADITNNDNSFIYNRVFGGDPNITGEKIAAAVIGSNDLTLSTLKHFPGHGEVEADSHTSIPTTATSYENWSQYDMIPFKYGIDAGADIVMFGHLRYSSVDQYPASLSLKWHEILKDDLGFKGLTITDDMGMLQDSGEIEYSDSTKNAIDAINAGNTLLLYVLGGDNSVSGVGIGEIIDSVVKAVDDGNINLGLINRNVRQILTVRHSLSQE